MQTVGVKRRSSKGKGGKSGGGGCGGGGSGRSGGGGGGGGVGSGGSGGGSGGFGGGGGGSGGGRDGGGGGSGSGGGSSGGGWGGAVQWGGLGGGQRQQQERRSETSTPEQLLPTRSSTVLPCPAVPSGSLSSLHLPSFSMNLVTTTAALQDAMVTATTPRGLRVSICRCTRTGRHLATFTCRPPQVAASAQVSASGLCLPLPPLPATPCLPCIEGQQRAAPHSSSFPPTTTPLQTLHMDVWGPARVNGQGRERYFLLVVDDYTRYTTVFPLRSKGEVFDVLIPWIRAVRLQLRERFREDLPVLRLHSDRGGDFSSDLLWDFCRGEGIFLSFTLPASPQQNGVAESCIGLVMEVARTSMIHAAAPHFLWPFAVRYAAHHLNFFPHVSLPETSPTLRWTGKVGDVPVFRVWGSRTLDRDTSADKLSSHAIPCVFLGFPPDALGRHFYHPTSRRLLPSQDVTFDESIPLYHLFPYRTDPLPPPTLFLAPGSPPVDPLPPQGPAPSGVSQVDPLPLAVPVEVAVDSGSARGAASRGAASRGAASGGADLASAEPGGAEPKGTEPGGAKSEGAEPGGTEPEGAETGGAESKGAESGGAEPRGTTFAEGPVGCSPRLSHRREPLSPQQLHEWFAQRTRVSSGVARAGGSAAGGTGAGGAGAGDPGARGPGAGGAGVGGPSAGGTVQRHPFFVPPQQSSLPPPDSLQPDSPLPAPPPYTEQTESLLERREPESRPASPVRAVLIGRRVPRSRPPPKPGTHIMALHPSSVPLRVPLLSPPASSIPNVLDPESDLARAASPTVPHLLATIVTNPSFESTAVSALVAELVDFAAACRLDYATSLVAESESDCPPSVGGGCAFGTDVLEDTQEDFEFLAAAVPHLVAMLLAPEGDPDAPDFPTPRSYTEAITVPHSGANIIDGMWIFRPTRGDLVAPPIWLHWVVSCKYPVEPPASNLRFPCEWHDTLRTTLAALGFAPSIADPSLFLRTDTSLPPFYVLVYVDDLVFATADTETLAIVKLELQKRHTCTDLGPSALRLPILLATVHSSAYRSLALSSTFGRVRITSGLVTPPCTGMPEWTSNNTFYLGSGSVSWRSIRSSSVLSLSCEAEIYAGAMAAQELRWLTYLLADLGERPRSSPVLYVDNKAMIALCQEHRTKHIALRYFLPRELQQRGQLRLAYVATRANTADIFTKALQSGDH
ncbi:unnamed protein product [Closterium sp. NIES-53]